MLFWSRLPIDNLLEMSRRQASRIGVPAEYIDIAKVTKDAAEKVSELLPSHQYSIDFPPLPPVAADPVHMERILYNLIHNAAKFSLEGSPIAIFADLKGASLVIGVRDKGQGIFPEDHERLFDRFGRAGAAPDCPGGLGLGLVTCKTLVEAHAGNIWVESEPCEGSTFFFTIPLRDSKAQSIL